MSDTQFDAPETRASVDADRAHERRISRAEARIQRLVEQIVASPRGASWAEVTVALDHAAAWANHHADHPQDYE